MRNGMSVPPLLRFQGEGPLDSDLRSAQLERPVFLTNHSCEIAHGDAALLASLGLLGGEWAGQFYPLTAEEMARNAEDVVRTELGDVLTGYAVLYNGAKWFGPVIELMFRAERNGFDGALPSRDECLAILDARAEAMLGAVNALGGSIVLTTDADPGDRHTLQILLRSDLVCAWCPDHATFSGLVTALAGGPRDALPPLAAVEGEHGDYYVIDLLTRDGRGHVASVTCWDIHGIADPAAVSHASQMKAAGDLHRACCGLLRSYLLAWGTLHRGRPPLNVKAFSSALRALAQAGSAAPDPRPDHRVDAGAAT